MTENIKVYEYNESLKNSNNKPFVGVIQPSAFAYTGGDEVIINAIPNTFRGEFWNTGDMFATTNQAVVGTGQLIGHLRYMSQENEGDNEG